METIPTAIIVYGVIQAIVFLTPVLLIAYRQGRKDQEIAGLRKDFDGLHEKVGKITATWDVATRALTDKINQVENNIGKMSISIDYIKETVREMKGGG